MYKIIFDRSILHGDKFDILQSSRLNKLVQSKKIKLFYTPRFLIETLALAPKRADECRVHMNWLIKLNDARWFHLFDEIIRSELNNQVLPNKYYLVEDAKRTDWLSRLSPFLKGKSDVVPGLEEYRNRESSYKTKVRTTLLAYRDQTPLSQYDLDRSLDQFVKDMLNKFEIADGKESGVYQTKWDRDRFTCRYTERYLRALFGTIWIPLSNRNLGIDRNDLADAEQLSYMPWADIFVSDDHKTMESNFDFLYHDWKGKLLLDSAKFIKLLQTLR